MTKRQTYLDIMKIISVFFVIVVHISAINFSKVDVNSTTWFACNLYDSIAHFAAPTLIMISGAVFLNPEKELNIKRLYRHNIFRIFYAFIFWSAAYSFVENYIEYGKFTMDFMHSFLLGLVEGHYHLWFCYAIIACYVVTPLLKQILKDEKSGKYLLMLSICVIFIVNALKLIPTFSFVFGKIFSEAGVVTGTYIAYFIIGYYINKVDIDKIGGGIALVGILSLAITISGSTLLSKLYGHSTEMLYDYSLPNTLLWASSVFLFIKKWTFSCKVNTMTGNTLKILAESSFGAYLVHVFVYNVFLRIGFTPTICTSFIAIPLLAVATWIASMILSVIISKIPLIGKFIV